ncbi:MAG TPA: sigma 54-interacting transcriptional regulator [Vicinamibacterales bacterium]|jgi:DNA-binding NtrC family response regulator
MRPRCSTAILPPALLGDSAAVRQIRTILERPAPSPILLLVEEGLEAADVARYVHDCTRGGQAFVRADCGRPDADGLAIELFGVRGRAAATLETLGPGAALLKAGRGTVFLDNLNELPAALQRRLARVLRDGEVCVGGRERTPLEARVIAAAPPSIAADAADGRFRPELLRRFAATPAAIPSLRARAGDVAAIVNRLAADLAAAAGRPVPRFTPAALTMLAALPWTGNVDELRATLQGALARVEDGVIRQEDLLPGVPFEGIVRRLAPAVSLREARRRFEREYIASVLERHGWRMSEAARTLGIERANLYRKTRELGIQRYAPGGRGDS